MRTEERQEEGDEFDEAVRMEAGIGDFEEAADKSTKRG